MKKRVVARAPIFVERTLSTGQTMRIPLKANKEGSGPSRPFQLAGAIELRDLVEMKGAAGRVLVNREQQVQTKAGNVASTVWVELGPLWLESNWTEDWNQDSPSRPVDRVQREVQSVLEALKQQIEAGRQVR